MKMRDMTKRKPIIPLIIAAVVFLLGAASVLFGMVQKSGYAVLKTTDLCEENVGTSLSFRVQNGFPMEAGSFLALVGEEETTSIMLSIPKEHKNVFLRAERETVCAIGTLEKCDETQTEKARMTMTDYFQTLQSAYEQNHLDTYDADLERAIQLISPYCIHITHVKGENDSKWMHAGMALMALSVLIVVLYLLRNTIPVKKILLILAAVVVLLATVSFLLFHDRIRTALSLTEVSDGFYTMTCYGDYHIDEYLNADCSTNEQLAGWITKKLYGFRYDKINVEDFGCSSFLAAASDGSYLMGRNFDYPETDALLIYNEPDDGYASIGMADLAFFGIGKYTGISPNSLKGRLLLLAASYICLDGVNEEGLGVSILQLDKEELQQDKGNPDLLVYAAIRCILDRCRTVDEAIALLQNYDVHSGLDCSFHLFIADKSGKSVVVEWLENEMVLTEDTAVTNFVLAKESSRFEGEGVDRYDTMKEGLGNGALDRRAAMLLLAAVQNKSQTEWSCVYNLSDGSVDVCLDNDYEETDSFTQEDFK